MCQIKKEKRKAFLSVSSGFESNDNHTSHGSVTDMQFQSAVRSFPVERDISIEKPIRTGDISIWPAIFYCISSTAIYTFKGKKWGINEFELCFVQDN